MRNFKKFVIFCLVGFSAFLIDWLIFNIIYWISSEFIFSKIISAIFSLTFNFNMNRNLTFSARGAAVKKQIIRWIIIYGISVSVNIAVGKLVLVILGENLLNANIAFFAGIAIAIPIGFFGSLLWAFKKNNE